MEVLLIRHGHSLSNQQEQRKGLSRAAYNQLVRQSPEQPLSAKGVAQARTLAHALHTEPVSRLYTSPFLRARQVAAILGATWGVRPRVWNDLRELMPAPLPERSSGTAPYRWLLLRSMARMLRPQPVAESWGNGGRRAWRVWHWLRRHPAPVVAVVSHGRFIRLLLLLAHLLPGCHVQHQQTGKATVSRIRIAPVSAAPSQEPASTSRRWHAPHVFGALRICTGR